MVVFLYNPYIVSNEKLDDILSFGISRYRCIGSSKSEDTMHTIKHLISTVSIFLWFGENNVLARFNFCGPPASEENLM